MVPFFVQIKCQLGKSYEVANRLADAELKQLLDRTGSDLRHLVKATYYVSDDVADRKLNEIRPEFYDPRRPPSASKARVPGVGLAGKSITLDMIAVTPR